MKIALFILWFIWGIPIVLYVFWKRSDWYLFIFPPIFCTIIMLLLALLSSVFSIIFMVALHLILILSFICRKNK